MFYIVERWLGGTLTNFSTVKKSIKRLHSLEKEGSTIFEDLTKKEILKLNREKIVDPSFSRECNLLILFLTVEKFVKVPPNHLSTI
jgi:hypothetical protein